MPEGVKKLGGWLAADVLNFRLNASENMLRKRIGAREVNRLIAEFKAEGHRTPRLWEMLYRQHDPYAWIYRRSQRRTPIPQPGQTAGP
jgi:hypothetical protein